MQRVGKRHIAKQHTNYFPKILILKIKQNKCPEYNLKFGCFINKDYPLLSDT